jgi:hypothetical protein
MRASPARQERFELAARLAIGLVWIAGAIFNLVVTMRMDAPFAWIEDSAIRPWGWFFSRVVSPHAGFWIALLVIWEFGIGAMTLVRGRFARFGLAGGALFSAFLFSLWTPYTMAMGVYALLLAWLAPRRHERSAIETARGRLRLRQPPFERSVR